jgi:hypothetical protein
MGQTKSLIYIYIYIYIRDLISEKLSLEAQLRLNQED